MQDKVAASEITSVNHSAELIKSLFLFYLQKSLRKNFHFILVNFLQINYVINYLAVSVYFGCNVRCLFDGWNKDFGSSISPGPPLTCPLCKNSQSLSIICDRKDYRARWVFGNKLVSVANVLAAFYVSS